MLLAARCSAITRKKCRGVMMLDLMYGRYMGRQYEISGEVGVLERYVMVQLVWTNRFGRIIAFLVT